MATISRDTTRNEVCGELIALISTSNLEIKSILFQQLTYYHNQPNSRLRDSLKQV
jgi:hypothetical protein